MATNRGSAANPSNDGADAGVPSRSSRACASVSRADCRSRSELAARKPDVACDRGVRLAGDVAALQHRKTSLLLFRLGGEFSHEFLDDARQRGRQLRSARRPARRVFATQHSFDESIAPQGPPAAQVVQQDRNRATSQISTFGHCGWFGLARPEPGSVPRQPVGSLWGPSLDPHSKRGTRSRLWRPERALVRLTDAFDETFERLPGE